MKSFLLVFVASSIGASSAIWTNVTCRQTLTVSMFMGNHLSGWRAGIRRWMLRTGGNVFLAAQERASTRGVCTMICLCLLLICRAVALTSRPCLSCLQANSTAAGLTDCDKAVRRGTSAAAGRGRWFFQYCCLFYCDVSFACVFAAVLLFLPLLVNAAVEGTGQSKNPLYYISKKTGPKSYGSLL